jgi:hypothetical protein
MSCEKLEQCPFYNDKMPIDSALGRLFKKNYCESDKTRCARYRVTVTLGKEYVPDNLYPNMEEKAESIIQANSKR